MEEKEDEILTLQEAADFLRVGRNAMSKMVNNGEIPGKKVGREWRFSRQALLKWLENGQAKNKK
ncbi:MAG: Helix-turn-helix domain protein [Pelotomaculum sp. PtaB.Bin104]|nr:MAG: Helix-turn-helix domain protein [Pelotomaculum sp. PtaB.Bin104]